MSYAESTSVKSLSSKSAFSVFKLLLNNSILLSVNKRMNGLSFTLGVFMSIKENLANDQICPGSNYLMSICFVLAF